MSKIVFRNMRSRGVRRISLLIVLAYLLAGCGVCDNIFHKGERYRCRTIYATFTEESNKAVQSVGLQKVAHLQAVEINTQLLIRDRCCRWKDTCVVSVWSE